MNEMQKNLEGEKEGNAMDAFENIQTKMHHENQCKYIPLSPSYISTSCEDTFYFFNLCNPHKK